LALSAFELQISHMMVWRGIQEQVNLLEKRRYWQPVRVLGVDGVYPLGKGRKCPVFIAVDFVSGQPVAIGVETDS
jgi:hypothetical protein